MSRNIFGNFQCITSALFVATISTIVLSSSPSLTEENKPEWGYGGASNPSRWSEVSAEFEACESGRDQSPIDIGIVEEEESTEIEFDFQPSAGEVIDNGHTIEVGIEPGNTVSLNEKIYELVQFHFHTPSEHTVENKSSAMELHFVHQNEAGKLAVVGVMIDSGEENEIISGIWNAIPNGNKSANSSTEIDIDIAKLLPKDKTFVSYPGSLTTPPCSEEVSWNLILEPIELSAEQIETFENIYPFNARPIQPLNGRSVNLND